MEWSFTRYAALWNKEHFRELQRFKAEVLLERDLSVSIFMWLWNCCYELGLKPFKEVLIIHRICPVSFLNHGSWILNNYSLNGKADVNGLVWIIMKQVPLDFFFLFYLTLNWGVNKWTIQKSKTFGLTFLDVTFMDNIELLKCGLGSSAVWPGLFLELYTCLPKRLKVTLKTNSQKWSPFWQSPLQRSLPVCWPISTLKSSPALHWLDPCCLDTVHIAVGHSRDSKDSGVQWYQDMTYSFFLFYYNYS